VEKCSPMKGQHVAHQGWLGGAKDALFIDMEGDTT